MTATIYSPESENNKTIVRLSFTVLPTGVLYLTGYDYGGWQFTLPGMALLTAYSFAVCFMRFRRRKKRYFWPNAQMREFIGLLASEWKINVAFIALTVFLSILFANNPTILKWIIN